MFAIFDAHQRTLSFDQHFSVFLQVLRVLVNGYVTVTQSTIEIVTAMQQQNTVKFNEE